MKILVVVAFFCFGVCVNSDGINSYDLDSDTMDSKENEYSVDNGYESQKYEYKNGYGTDANDYGENKRNEKQRDKYDEEDMQRLDEIFGYTGPTANDEPENLIRPCALDDWQCIRKYFAANSKCTPAYGPIPDPLKISSTVFFSAINLTTNFVNSVVRGLSTAKINDFYVNKKSGNLVIAIDVQFLNQTTPRAYYRYRRTGKESIVLAGYSTVDFQAATFTAVIPKVPHLRLDLADVHVDVDNGFPAYFIDPQAINSTDPDVITAAAQFPLILPILVREGLTF